MFGLAVQHLLPAIFIEAMCQFIMGMPHTLALRRPRCDGLCDSCFTGGGGWGFIILFCSAYCGESKFVKVIYDQCEKVAARNSFEVQPNLLLMLEFISCVKAVYH